MSALALIAAQNLLTNEALQGKPSVGKGAIFATAVGERFLGTMKMDRESFLAFNRPHNAFEIGELFPFSGSGYQKPLLVQSIRATCSEIVRPPALGPT